MIKLPYVTLLTIGALNFVAPSYAQKPINSAGELTQTLSIFVQHILQNSPLLQAENANIKAAEFQQKAAANSLYNPEIELAVEDKDGAPKSRLFGLSQTLDWRGKSTAAGKVAQFELQVAKAKRDQVQQTLTVELLSALANYHAAKAISTLTKRRSDLMRRFSEVTKEAFNVGDIEKSSYGLAQLAYAQALIQDSDIEVALSDRLQNLESLIGGTVDSINNLPVLPKILPTMKTGWATQNLIAKLPQIRILQNQKLVAEAAIRSSELNKVSDPTLSLMTGENEGDSVAGLSISFPINLFNSYENEVNVAKNQSLAEEKTLKNAYIFAQSKLKNTQKTYQLTSNAWRVWQKNGHDVLTQQIQILKQKFELNEINSTDYLVQIKQTLETQIAAQALYAKAWEAWFNWLLMSGNIKQWLGEKNEK